MKKVLFATVAAVMSTTAAMADVSFSEGRITALMTAANNFESRGINIVENSNKLAVHKTVTAWNQGWNALEGDNVADLNGKVNITHLFTSSEHGSFVTETSNVTLNDDGSATVNTGEGVSYVIEAHEVLTVFQENISTRDSRADEVSVSEGTAVSGAGTNSVGYAERAVYSISGDEIVRIDALDSFNEIKSKVENAIQKSYDSGFSDGYTCLLYTSPSPRDRQKSRMPSSA